MLSMIAIYSRATVPMPALVRPRNCRRVCIIVWSVSDVIRQFRVMASSVPSTALASDA